MIICDFIEGKIFQVNADGEKEETNEIDASQPLSFQVIVDEESEKYIGHRGYPLTLWVTKKDGTQTSQWEEVEGKYVNEKHGTNVHPLQGERFSPLPEGRYFLVLFGGLSSYLKFNWPMPDKVNQKVIKFYVSTKEAVLKKERDDAMADSKTINVGLKLPNDWKPDFQFKSHSDTEIKISWKTPCDTDDLINKILCTQSVTSLKRVSDSHDNKAAFREMLKGRKIAIEYNLEFNTGSSWLPIQSGDSGGKKRNKKGKDERSPEKKVVEAQPEEEGKKENEKEASSLSSSATFLQSVEGKNIPLRNHEFILEKDVHFSIDPRNDYPYACDEHGKPVSAIFSFRIKARAYGTFYFTFFFISLSLVSLLTTSSGVSAILT